MPAASQQIERLAELVVLLDPQDLPALAALHTELEGVGRWAEESRQPSLKVGLNAAADLVEKIILNEVDSPARALESVGKAIATIQAIVQDGRPPQEVTWPPELGIGAAAAPSTVAQNLSAPSPPAQPCCLSGDTALLGDFVTEATEHLEAADLHL